MIIKMHSINTRPSNMYLGSPVSKNDIIDPKNSPIMLLVLNTTPFASINPYNENPFSVVNCMSIAYDAISVSVHKTHMNNASLKIEKAFLSCKPKNFISKCNCNP